MVRTAAGQLDSDMHVQEKGQKELLAVATGVLSPV